MGARAHLRRGDQTRLPERGDEPLEICGGSGVRATPGPGLGLFAEGGERDELALEVQLVLGGLWIGELDAREIRDGPCAFCPVRALRGRIQDVWGRRGYGAARRLRRGCWAGGCWIALRDGACMVHASIPPAGERRGCASGPERGEQSMGFITAMGVEGVPSGRRGNEAVVV